MKTLTDEKEAAMTRPLTPLHRCLGAFCQECHGERLVQELRSDEDHAAQVCDCLPDGPHTCDFSALYLPF